MGVQTIRITDRLHPHTAGKLIFRDPPSIVAIHTLTYEERCAFVDKILFGVKGDLFGVSCEARLRTQHSS